MRTHPLSLPKRSPSRVVAVRTVLSAFVLSALAGACTVPATEPPAAAPERIFHNARIYTVDASDSWQQAMAVSDGQITAIGADDAIRALAGPSTRLIDLEGRTVFPGIQDMHVHPMDGGIQRTLECAFGATLNAAEIVDAVTACAATWPAGTWLQGGQWGTTILEEDRVPDKTMLDAASAELPIFLMDWSVHNAWVNSRALELLGIDDDTPNPPGGEIVRDPNTGEATGILLDNAAYQARNRIPDYTTEQRMQALEYSIEQMLSFGVTSFRDAITTDANLVAYRRLADEGRLPARAQISNPWKSAWSKSHDTEIDNIRNHTDSAAAHLDTSFAKIMLDGVPLTYTSAVLEPYEPSTQYGAAHLGELMHAPDTLAEDVAFLDRAGVTVKIHATGDRAVRVALDAIQHARRQNPDSAIMHEISHAEMIHPDDLPRFRALNVAAEMCPILWYPNPGVDTMRITLGERAERMWPARSLIDQGALVFYGSDWPAVVPNTNPWPGIEALVTRADPYGTRTGTLWPEQAVSLATAVRIFTINGATAGKQADRTGSLEVGKRADFIVLEHNPFEVPIEAVSDTRVLNTFVDGVEIHRAVSAQK